MLGKERPPHLSKTSGRKGGGEEAGGGGGGKRNIPSLARKTEEREGREKEREREKRDDDRKNVII